MNSSLFNSVRNTINIVTGCNSGLGKATLEHLLKKGSAGIVGIDRRLDDSLLEQFGKEERLLLRAHNTQDEEAVETTLDLALKKFGRLDNLINVAGISAAFQLHSRNSALVYGLNHFNDLLSFNTIGSFNICRWAIKYMLKDSDNLDSQNTTKCIINVSCISTEDALTGQSGYSATRGAVDSMTFELARELAPHRIRANTIKVGYFNTKLLQATSPLLIDYLEKEMNLLPNRLGELDEFTHLVQTILENQMLNGSSIRLDAGARPNIFKTWLSD